ncbi:MAG: class I SAM-dependent methyltransferase [Nitrosarchaeum sp.]|nr:class I SAM-dependent methyltransferase [Nitrosarchaeum sp.]
MTILLHKSKKYFQSLRSLFIKFDPNTFWNIRGKSLYENNPYSNKEYKEQEQLIISYLKNLNFSSVLEVGCGYGRITKLLKQNFQIQNYLATDLSSDLIKTASAYNKEFQDIEFRQSTIQDLELDEKFDLVICTEVLQHVLPKDIDSVAQKLVNLSNKHIINVDSSFDKIPEYLAKHNFAHNYNKIYSRCHGIKDITEKKFGVLNHSLFHAQK